MVYNIILKNNNYYNYILLSKNKISKELNINNKINILNYL